MPKDSHLLPQHSQDILRLARSGRLYQKRLSTEDDEVDVDPSLGEKPDKKEEPTKEGFVVKTWKQVPKHLEGPEIEYLAKRRKNIMGQAVKNSVVAGPTMTKTTVRRTDADGNIYVQDLVVPEGQTVEGEVISQVVISDPATTGLAVEAPAPIKRRPAPPRRKAKGPGRGRRKRAPAPPTSVPGAVGSAPTEVKTEENSAKEAAVGPDVSSVITIRPICTYNIRASSLNSSLQRMERMPVQTKILQWKMSTIPRLHPMTREMKETKGKMMAQMTTMRVKERVMMTKTKKTTNTTMLH